MSGSTKKMASALAIGITSSAWLKLSSASPSNTPAATWPRLAAFRATHPGLELMLNPTSELVDLELGGVDVAVRYGNGDWAGVEAELLFRGSFAVVAARSLIGDR